MTINNALVSTEWLDAHLQSPDIVVIDASCPNDFASGDRVWRGELQVR